MMAQLMGLPVISPERLKGQVDGNQVTVIDVNSAERSQQAHVRGALHLNGANSHDRGRSFVGPEGHFGRPARSAVDD